MREIWKKRECKYLEDAKENIFKYILSHLFYFISFLNDTKGESWGLRSLMFIFMVLKFVTLL